MRDRLHKEHRECIFLAQHTCARHHPTHTSEVIAARSFSHRCEGGAALACAPRSEWRHQQGKKRHRGHSERKPSDVTRQRHSGTFLFSKEAVLSRTRRIEMRKGMRIYARIFAALVRPFGRFRAAQQTWSSVAYFGRSGRKVDPSEPWVHQPMTNEPVFHFRPADIGARLSRRRGDAIEAARSFFFDREVAGRSARDRASTGYCSAAETGASSLFEGPHSQLPSGGKAYRKANKTNACTDRWRQCEKVEFRGPIPIARKGNERENHA